MHEFNVVFNPQNKAIRVAKGTDLLTAAIRCGIVLNANCGGDGLCGKCRVVIKNGNARVEVSRLVPEAERRKGVVLACQTLVEGDLEVEIPKESLGLHEKLSHDAEEFTKGVILKRENKYPHSPLVRKIYIELPNPTHDDNLSDLDRILRALEVEFRAIHVSARLASMKHLGEVIREGDFKVTVMLGHKEDAEEILAIESGNTAGTNLGIAFDIGTTTVVGQLIDLNTKDILGSRIAFNKQASYGSDVITRIIYASEPKGLEDLSKAVLDNMYEIIEELAQSSNVNMDDINSVVCAGNMTMMHLLLKVDPTNIRKEPYIPAATAFPPINTSDLNLEINPKGLACFFPGVSTYIGGDIVSGILACGLAESDDIALLADIGTNGEVVLGNKEWMVAAAASAGPAFEGSGLAHGMKAVKGAIDRVSISGSLELKYDTIGGERPKGICGSGYIDLLCQMLKNKIIGKDGKINREIKSPRIRKGDSTYEFIVAFKDEGAISKDIVVDEDDIENLKRAKGAIYSAIIALLNKVEKKISDVKKIYIAGGFGNYLNIENAVFIGLLPDTEKGVYEFVGNSSLAGARMSLVSYDAFRLARDICRNITYIDLSSEPGYMDEYIAALFFPHTDAGRFPSVRL